ncbi:hypothetical protein [Mesorhizobium sp. CAU 1732]|uniref:hypothetical protein n=1 Tax=Mesorhizobium sp. CAU 1732 TaxID=3140358 RepID=UPI0032603D65
MARILARDKDIADPLFRPSIAAHGIAGDAGAIMMLNACAKHAKQRRLRLYGLSPALLSAGQDHAFAMTFNRVADTTTRLRLMKSNHVRPGARS